MSDELFEQRLAGAQDRLAGLTPALEAGGPWPLAARFDHSPEASWGPPETLAHVAEMLSYWLGEAERILAAGEGSTAFGRTPSDDVRLGTIERDRNLPIRELCTRVDAGIERWRGRWPELDEDARRRPGAHVTLGTLTVTDIANRFVAGHLEDHLDQLAESAAGGSTAG